MKTIKNFAVVLAAAVLVLGACKKGETGPAGKDGAAGSNAIVPSQNNGYITANISGTRKDGAVINEVFDYRYYFGGPAGSLDSVASNQYRFSISRSENDILGSNFCSIDIETTSKTATTGTLTMSYLNYEKSIGPNKVFRFYTGSSTVAVSGLNYNTGTGVLSGSFNLPLTGFQNSSGNAATITGSFQATITQYYNKTSITSTDITD